MMSPIHSDDVWRLFLQRQHRLALNLEHHLEIAEPFLI